MESKVELFQEKQKHGGKKRENTQNLKDHKEDPRFEL